MDEKTRNELRGLAEGMMGFVGRRTHESVMQYLRNAASALKDGAMPQIEAMGQDLTSAKSWGAETTHAATDAIKAIRKSLAAAEQELAMAERALAQIMTAQ